MGDSGTSEFTELRDRLAAAVEESDESTADDRTMDEERKDDERADLDVSDARDVGRAVTGDLTGFPLDRIVEVERRGDQWRVVAEVVERRAVPDTQDLLGRYVITLDTAGGVRGYGRNRRYRRGNLAAQ